MSSRLYSALFKIFLTSSIVLKILFFSSCDEPGMREDRDYILSAVFRATEDPLDVQITIEDLETEEELSAPVSGTLPIDEELYRGIIYYTDTRIIRIAAEITGLPANGEAFFDVWYEEIEEFPPENALRLAGARHHTDETGLVTDITLYIDIAVPFPSGF